MVGVLGDAYRLGGPDYLEAHIYPSREAMHDMLVREALAVGAAVVAEYEVMHEAWHGYPRIHVAASTPLDRLRPLLVHEAMHALLHGSIDYYLPVCSTDPVTLQLASTTVKDLEVSVEMARRGFWKELEALASMLETSGDCCRVETVSDELRRYVAMLPLGRPDARCSTLLGAVTSLLEELYERARRGERVWSEVCRLARAIEDAMKKCRVIGL